MGPIYIDKTGASNLGASLVELVDSTPLQLGLMIKLSENPAIITAKTGRTILLTIAENFCTG